MRPVQLEMKGFGSFRKPACVRFSDADYFVLVGPTGSGKSTVIDAITFALYGSVPRWNDLKSVGLALAPTVTRGTVKLVFDLGLERYVVARDIRRDRSGQVTTREARMERLADPDGFADAGEVTTVLAAGRDVTKSVEKLIGLSFENFTKCVVLPQGKFAEFMTATPRERREILVRLLGLDFYAEMMKRANSRAEILGAEAASCAEQLEKYTDVTDDALASATSRVVQLERLESDVLAQLKGLASEQQELDRLDSDRRTAGQELDLLQAVVVPAGIEGLAGEHAAARQAAEASAAAFEVAQRRCTQARDLVESAPDPGQLQQVRKDRRRLSELRADELAATTGLVAADAQAAAAEVEHSEAAQAAQAAVAKAEAAAARRAEQESSLAERQAALDRVTAVSSPDRLLADIAAAGKKAEATAAAFVTADEALQAAERQDLAASMRHGLHAGDDCPVCLRPVTEIPPSGDADRAVAEARATRDRAEVAAATAGREQASAQQRARALLMTARDSLVALGAPAATDDVAASWRELMAWTERQRGQLAAQTADLRERLAAADSAARTAEDQLSATRAAAKDADTRLRDALAEQAKHQSAVTHLAKEIARLESATSGQPADEQIDAEIARIKQLRADEQQAFATMQQAQQRADADRRAFDTRDADLQRARRSFDDARGRVAALAPPEPHSDDLTTCWEGLARWAGSLAGERRRRRDELEDAIAASRASMTTIRDGVVAAISSAGLPVRDDDVAAWVPAALAGERAGAAAQAEHLEAVLQDKEELTRRHTEKVEQQQVAASLGRELQSNRFQDWVIRSAFDLLVADASRTLLELSGDQFSLRLEGSEFSVVDHTDADAVRPVKTLSGGETFQASLALALALSEHITAMAAGGGVRLESILLDEGFGTLDGASLDQVAVTLESLVGKGRTVGIVTHVRSLADRVPVRFAVSRDQHSSTVVRESE